MTETALQRRLRERREAQAATTGPSSPTELPILQARPEDADLVPDADSAYERSEDELTIDRVIDGIDILEAYQRWIGKKIAPHRSGKREGIHVSCPLPSHPDHNPSAWVNLDKKTWYCGGCDIGGDIIDLAAIHFGMGDYKSGKNFGEIRKRIAQDYGYTFVPVPGRADPIIVAPAPEEASEQTPDAGVEPPPAPAPTGIPAAPVPVPVLSAVPVPVAAPAGPPLASVSSITPHEDEDEDDESYNLPTLDWQEVVTPGTFLDAYMRCTTEDDVPEEYHFWMGMLAIGMAIGRDVVLQDRKLVKGNLFLCVLGRTGSGKSRATENLNTLLQTAIPWSPSDPLSRGVKYIPTPSSGENLINHFSQLIYDPSNPKVVLGHQPIRGVVDYNELSALVSRTGRQGSTLKPILMEFYDAKPDISTSSNTGGTFRAQDAFGSILTTTQPKALRGLVTQEDMDSGFLNRWIFVSGKMKEREAFGGTTIDLMPAVSPLMAIHEWADGGKKILWSNDEAKAAYLRLFKTRLDPAEMGENQLLGRVNLVCKKLVLLLTANEMREEVTEEIVFKVEKIYDYLLKVWGVPERELGRTESREIEDKIMKIAEAWATKNPKSPAVPLRHIVKYFQAKKYESYNLERALKVLVALGRLEPYVPTERKPGRPPGAAYRMVEHD